MAASGTAPLPPGSCLGGDANFLSQGALGQAGLSDSMQSDFPIAELVTSDISFPIQSQSQQSPCHKLLPHREDTGTDPCGEWLCGGHAVDEVGHLTRIVHIPWCPESGQSVPDCPVAQKPAGSLKEVLPALTIRSLGRSDTGQWSRRTPCPGRCRRPGHERTSHLVHRNAQGVQHIFHHGVGGRLGLEKGVDVALVKIQAGGHSKRPIPHPAAQAAGFGDQLPPRSTIPFR